MGEMVMMMTRMILIDHTSRAQVFHQGVVMVRFVATRGVQGTLHLLHMGIMDMGVVEGAEEMEAVPTPASLHTGLARRHFP